MLLLVLTRVEVFKIKENIRSDTPFFRVHLGNLFTFRMSAWLVFEVSEIFETEPGLLAWRYDFLYVPFFLPFIVVSLVTVLIYRRQLPPGSNLWSPFASGFKRCAILI